MNKLKIRDREPSKKEIITSGTDKITTRLNIGDEVFKSIGVKKDSSEKHEFKTNFLKYLGIEESFSRKVKNILGLEIAEFIKEEIEEVRNEYVKLMLGKEYNDAGVFAHNVKELFETKYTWGKEFINEFKAKGNHAFLKDSKK